MATKLEFLLPKFGHDYWSRIGAPAKAGEIKQIAASDTFIRDERAFDITDERFRVMAREAKPSMWAHAETFHQVLAARVEHGDTAAEEFELWGGLLAAVFQGDLEVVPQSGADLKQLDEDLYPALRASLPITPDASQWPSVLVELHRDGGLTVLRAGAGGAIVGAGYAPCLVFPALQSPNAESEERLAKFKTHAGAIDMRLSTLLDRYGAQRGFSQAFSATLADLATKLRDGRAGTTFLSLQRAVTLLQKVVDRRQATAAAAGDAPARKAGPVGLLGYLYDNVSEREYRGAGVGNVGFWAAYPLSARAGGKTVLFIPEGVDVAANPWARGMAFPGADTHTQLCDLSIHRKSDSGAMEVWGRDGRVYEVSPDHVLLSLHPQAPLDLRVALDSLLYLEGANALDPKLLHEVHNQWRRGLTNREDVTPLIPLHTNLLQLFPGYIAAPSGLVELAAGKVGDGSSADAVCRLRLPIIGNDAVWFTWKARLFGAKLDNMRLPSADVWPAFRGNEEPRWSAYFVRTQYSTSNLGLFFHGEGGIRERPAVGSGGRGKAAADDLYSIDRLTSPPRLAEVVSTAGGVAAQVGLAFISPATYSEVGKRTDPWQVAVDFGTSNTSVAVSAGEGEEESPRTLSFRPWAAPLLYPSAMKVRPAAAYPGWFLQGSEKENFHRGFFPTLLGYRQALALDEELITTLANLVNQTSEGFGDLVGSFDLLGIRGALAVQIGDSKGLSADWGIEDNLKWPSADADDARERRRKAFRAAFLELLLLHLCAEAYAVTGTLPARYTFTYPLSMKRPEVNTYRTAARRAVEVVEGLILPGASGRAKPDVTLVNESQAVFRAFMHARGHQRDLRANKRAVLIDMGGGSADYAVFAGNVEAEERSSGGSQLCFLDSMVLAGNRFFEFLQDISSDREYAIFEKSFLAITPDLRERIPSLSELRDKAAMRRLRQFYTLRVGSMMPEKSPFFRQAQDLVSLEDKEAQVAETIGRTIDSYSAGHWMRALFSIVVAHGLRLAIAPLGRQANLTSIELVLAGNGWRLLHHAGLVRGPERITALVRDIYERLRDVLAGDAGEPNAAALPEPDRISASFLDDSVREILDGQGVYSKDVVAAGAILEAARARRATGQQQRDDHIQAYGIVGLDLPVVADTGAASTGAGQAGSEPILLPWHTSVDKNVIDPMVERAVKQRMQNGGNGRIKIVKLKPHPSVQAPHGGPHSVREQLLALGLLETGGYGGGPDGMLSADSWDDWNGDLFDELKTALRIYGAAASGQAADASSTEVSETTSLVCGIWKYPLLKAQVRRGLFRTMNGGS